MNDYKIKGNTWIYILYILTDRQTDTENELSYDDKTLGPKVFLKHKFFSIISARKSWQQHPTKHQLYSHLPPITKTV